MKENGDMFFQVVPDASGEDKVASVDFAAEISGSEGRAQTNDELGDGATKDELIAQFIDRIMGCDCADVDVDEECWALIDDGEDNILQLDVAIQGHTAIVHVGVEIVQEEDGTVSSVKNVAIHDLSQRAKGADLCDAPELEDLREMKYVLDKIADRFEGVSAEEDECKMWRVSDCEVPEA